MTVMVRGPMYALIIRGLAASVVVVFASFALVRPAEAKGPSSATLSGPGMQPPIHLDRSTDADAISQLFHQTGLWTASAGALADQPDLADLGPHYRLTWINLGLPVSRLNCAQSSRTSTNTQISVW